MRAGRLLESRLKVSWKGKEMKRRITEVNEVDMLEVSIDKPLVSVRVTNLATGISAMGHAKCDPTDRWNEEFGYKLAQVRAVNRVTRKMEKHWVNTTRS